MVGPGGTTALWCRWYGTLVLQRPGEPPWVTRAGAGQEACAGGHGGGGGPPGGRGTITLAMLAASGRDEAVLPAVTGAPS
jgi:hypothetical protein